MNPRLYIALGLSFAAAVVGGTFAISSAVDKDWDDAVVNALDHNIDADLRAAVDAEIKRRAQAPHHQ